jgi:murein DD-endopeptidase MepM/ murein hydrolase activator NlpD
MRRALVAACVYLVLASVAVSPVSANVSAYYWLPWNSGTPLTVTVGNNVENKHEGIDAYAWDFGGSWTVRAARGGVVSATRDSYGTGGCDQSKSGQANYVKVKHDDNTETLYAHLLQDSIPAQVRVGTRIKAYDVLGTSDTSGYACGAHLHYQVQEVCTASSGFCQSTGSSFLDSDVLQQHSNGIPVTDDEITSSNHVSYDDLFLYRTIGGCYPVEFANGSGGWTPQSCVSWGAGWQIYPGYYNEDELLDIFIYNTAGGCTYVEFANGSGGWNAQSCVTYGSGWNIYPGDYNGNGLTDLFLYKPGSVGCSYVELSSGSGSWSAPGGCVTYGSGWQIYPGHLNSDAYMDLFLYKPAGGCFPVEFANGSGDWTAQTCVSWGSGWSIYPGRFNGDGLMDVYIYNSNSNPGCTYVEMSSGGGSWSAGPCFNHNAALQFYPGNENRS